MSGFSYSMLVRWSDIDSYDHVNNVRYFDYLQEARLAFIAQLFGSTVQRFFGEFPCVLVSQTVDYLRPIVLRHPPYQVEVWVESVGRSSYTLGSRIVDQATDGSEPVVYARATSVLVAVDGDTHRKRPLCRVELDALTPQVSAT